MGAIGVPGALLAGWTVEPPYLGRLRLLAISTCTCLLLIYLVLIVTVLLTLCIIALTGLLLFGSTTSGSSATLEVWLQAASQFHEKHHVAIGLK